jgi:hypothetical protein
MDKEIEPPSKAKIATCAPTSKTGSPIATTYHRGATRQRTILRAHPRTDAPEYQVTTSAARAGPNWVKKEHEPVA